MSYEHLKQADRRVLNGLLQDKHITSRHLPLGGVSAWDVMGVIMNPKTNDFYPGAQEGLARFATEMKRYGVMIIATTNGPDQPEGKFFLGAIPAGIETFVVTQGGAKITFKHADGKTQERITAHPDDMAKLGELETHAGRFPLVAALLRDRQPTDGLLPSRTEFYDANTVITLPNDYAVLRRRLRAEGVRLERVIPGIDENNYVTEVLDYVRHGFEEIIHDPDLNMADAVQVVVKPTNRRVYALPQHLYMVNAPLNKNSGATLDTRHWSPETGFQIFFREYTFPKSTYTADGARVETAQGPDIGSAEASMIKGISGFEGGPDPDDNILRYRGQSVATSRHTLIIAEATARLVMNVTLKDDSPLRMDWVRGVPMLDVRSGVQALQAWEYLYDRATR